MSLQLHPGAPPPGAVDAWFLQSVMSEDGGWEADAPAGLMEVVTWGTGLGQTVLLAAKPPRPGENWLRWNSGLRDAEGWSAIGSHGGPGMPYGPLEASGGSIGCPGSLAWAWSVALSPSGRHGCGCCCARGGRWNWCRSMPGIASRSTSMPACIGNPSQTSGGTDGMLLGWSPTTRPVAGSPSISTGAADSPADPGLSDRGKRLAHSASLRRFWSPASRGTAASHGGCAQLAPTEDARDP
jgi:hypothetical protein